MVKNYTGHYHDAAEAALDDTEAGWNDDERAILKALRDSDPDLCSIESGGGRRFWVQEPDDENEYAGPVIVMHTSINGTTNVHSDEV